MPKKGLNIPWDQIETVLLDMDGTLIDDYHEDVFWHKIVPKAFAAKHGVDFEKAVRKVQEIYDSKRGTLEWGTVDKWARDLDLDVLGIRLQLRKLIKLHPHTIKFL